MRSKNDVQWWEKTTHLLAVVLSIGSCLLVTACGSRESTATDSQVIAHVNDSEITLTHLQVQLSRETGVTKSAIEARRRALDGLVDQELLRQKAVENELDRNPDVLMRIEAARDRILADAYVQHKVLPQSRLRQEQIETYFYEHPALFRERRKYQLTVFNTERALPPTIMQRLELAKTPTAVAAMLRSADIHFDSSSVSRLADQLPLAIVDKFARATIGDVVVLESGDGSVAISVIEGVENAGVSLEEARPAIENYLTNVRNQEVYAQTLQQLRSTAELSYLGEFAGMQLPPPPPLSASETVAPAATASATDKSGHVAETQQP